MTKSLILRALARNGWNLTHAANDLGINRTYVYKLLRRYGITRP